VRLVLHTAAYWLVLGVRDAIPAGHKLAPAEFNTIRLHLLKIAARIGETATPYGQKDPMRAAGSSSAYDCRRPHHIGDRQWQSDSKAWLARVHVAD